MHFLKMHKTVKTGLSINTLLHTAKTTKGRRQKRQPIQAYRL
jgi:hypothetical protein